MKHFALILVSLFSLHAVANGGDSFGPSDLVFKCNVRLRSNGDRIFVHINGAEARFSNQLGTYDVKPCTGPYHSCFNIVTEDGQGFNSSLVSLAPTYRRSTVQLVENLRGSLLNNAVCSQMNY